MSARKLTRESGCIITAHLTCWRHNICLSQSTLLCVHARFTVGIISHYVFLQELNASGFFSTLLLKPLNRQLGKQLCRSFFFRKCPNDAAKRTFLNAKTPLIWKALVGIWKSTAMMVTPLLKDMHVWMFSNKNLIFLLNAILWGSYKVLLVWLCPKTNKTFYTPHVASK